MALEENQLFPFTKNAICSYCALQEQRDLLSQLSIECSFKRGVFFGNMRQMLTQEGWSRQEVAEVLVQTNLYIENMHGSENADCPGGHEHIPIPELSGKDIERIIFSDEEIPFAMRVNGLYFPFEFERREREFEGLPFDVSGFVVKEDGIEIFSRYIYGRKRLSTFYLKVPQERHANAPVWIYPLVHDYPPRAPVKHTPEPDEPLVVEIHPHVQYVVQASRGRSEVEVIPLFALHA